MIPLQFLRSRVARRLLTLFLACAIIPVITFAFFAYRVTSVRLQADARAALQHSSKLAGMIVMNRLQELRGELGGRGERSVYTAVAVESADGGFTPVFGAFPAPPGLSAAQQNRIAEGTSVLVTDTAGGRTWVFNVVPEPGAHSGFPRRWGMVSAEQIVDIESSLSPAPAGTSLCLLDGRGRALVCPDREAERGLADSTLGAGPDLTWSRGDSVFSMSRWSLFLGREFGAATWTVALSTPQAASLLPLAGFRRTFYLGVALSVLLVFVVSHIQLRRRMMPLDELEEGVRRISSGQFATRVQVQSNDEFQSLAGSFNHMAADLNQQFSTLNALRAVDLAALETRSARAIADVTLKWAPTLVDGERSALAYATAEHPARWLVRSAAARGEAPRETIVTPTSRELEELGSNSDFLPIASGESARSYCGEDHFPIALQRIVFPLRHDGRVHAALIVGRGAQSPFGIAPMSAGRQLADQLSVGLSNVALLGELDALSLGAMTALARTIDAVSPWTAGHSERVTLVALEIARRLDVDRVLIERLRRGGLLHDIGKIAVPSAILDKAGPLTPEEREVVQSHPGVGAEIIRPIAAFRDLIPLVRHHHELLDGTGYPDGLTGSAIPMIVRILTVADIYDALNSDRPYRAGLSSREALRILTDGAGAKYDVDAVHALGVALREGWVPPRITKPAPGGGVVMPAAALPGLKAEELFT